MAGRGILLVLDSVGCGGAPDAERFGDAGANTLLHIAEACAAGRAEDGRSGPLHLPNLDRLGLGAAIATASGTGAPGLGRRPAAAWGAATEVSAGKDTPSGHWELAGLPVPFDWHYFPQTVPTFPAALTDALIARADLPGILGNCHASGMPILRTHGMAHIRSGKPIFYTSTDSVLQIAAHETAFGLDRLLALCALAAEHVHPMRVGRVIARPFVGDTPESFKRTANRRDFAYPPPAPTLCDRVEAAGRRVIGIGKIGDIFAGRGVSETVKGADDMALFDGLLTALDRAAPGDLIFANFVEFDTLWGHTRDVAGYARALETFDARMPALLARIGAEDLLVITADHGNDPTWPGSDHTRERVPVLMVGPEPGPLGQIAFADVGETLAHHLALAPGPHGRSVL